MSVCCARRVRYFLSRLPANPVGPERHLGGGTVAPQHIEARVPSVERLIIRALEARPEKTKHLHVVAVDRLDDVRRYMRDVGNSAYRRSLASNGGLFRKRAHRGRALSQATTVGSLKVRRCPFRLGRSRLSGE